VVHAWAAVMAASRDLKALMREVDRQASVCRWPECTARVPPVMCLCGEHWRTLPGEFRRKLEHRYHGAGNNIKAVDEIEGAVAMYKKNSGNLQDRARRQTEHSTQNTAGVDMSAFADEAVEVRDRILGEQISQIELKLGRVNALIQESELRRGTFATRSVNPSERARWVQEKRLLMGELNAARLERMKFHQERLRRQKAGRADRDKEFDMVFRAVAKEVLAGPVYDRIITATIHRIGEADNAA
jgi:hypothetical protein